MSAFPDSHTTGTTVTSTTTTAPRSIRFDPYYIRSVPGLLKVAAVCLDLIAFICVETGGYYYNSHRSWFGFVSMTAFWVTLILLAFYVFHIVERLYNIPWLLAEFIYCVVWTVFYLIASIVVATKGDVFESWAVGAFFGFCAMIVYGVDAFLKFRGWRDGDVAQGDRPVQTTTTTTVVTTTATSTDATKATTPAEAPSYPAY